MKKLKLKRMTIANLNKAIMKKIAAGEKCTAPVTTCNFELTADPYFCPSEDTCVTCNQPLHSIECITVEPCNTGPILCYTQP